MIYYVEFEPNNQAENPYTRFVGVFSTTQKAQEACQFDCEERLPDGKRLLWVGYGDSIRASCKDGLYVVMTLELDARVKVE